MTSPRKSIFGWMMFDWATQPQSMLLLTFIFAPYFAGTVVSDPVEGQSIWSFAVGAAGFCIAIGAPLIGTLSDRTGHHKRWIAWLSVPYVLGCAALWWAYPDMDSAVPILLAFAAGLIALEFMVPLNNAMLPRIAPAGEVGRISGAAWGWGYFGGLIALVFMLTCLIADPQSGKTLIGIDPLFGFDPQTRDGERFSGPLTALWYVVFILPFFLWTTDTPRPANCPPLKTSLKGLYEQVKGLPADRGLGWYLISSMLYRDALLGIYAVGAIYAKGVLGWESLQLGIFGIIASLVGAVASWIGGYIDRAKGAKTVLVWSIAVLALVCVVVILTSRESVLFIPVGPDSSLPDTVFFIVGGVIGGAGAMLQASSRTMVTELSDEESMSRSFGLYALCGKATSFLAPTLIGVFTQVFDTQQAGVVPVVGLFVVGLVILLRVRTS